MNYISPILFLLSLSLQLPRICATPQNWSNATNETFTTTYPSQFYRDCYENETVVALVATTLTEATDYQLQLSTNVSTWNVSLMVKLINETDPTFLYSESQINLLIQFIPKCVIVQLPSSLLLFHGLCTFLPNITKYSNCSPEDYTNVDYDYCIGALTHSNNKNPVQRDNVEVEGFSEPIDLSNCGLACSSAVELQGIPKDEQRIIDLCKLVGCSLCFAFVIFLLVTLVIDHRRKTALAGKKVKRPLLHDIPYIITLALFVVVFVMTFGEMIGKKNIMCIGDEYSFDNPGEGGNIVCTIDGVFIYGALLYYEFYTVLLSFVICRQLYNPMNPLWKIPKYVWHLVIFAIVCAFETYCLFENAFAGVWPMGVCLPHGTKEILFVSLCVPLIFSAVVTGVFTFFGSYLMCKQVRAQRKVADSTDLLKDLMVRMILYSIVVLSNMILLAFTAMQFYDTMDKVAETFQEIALCNMVNEILGTDNPCKRTYATDKIWYINWVIICCLASCAQLFLSCHSDARARMKHAPAEMGSALKRVVSEISPHVSPRGSRRTSPRTSPRGSQHDSRFNDNDDTTTANMSSINLASSQPAGTVELTGNTSARVIRVHSEPEDDYGHMDTGNLEMTSNISEEP